MSMDGGYDREGWGLTTKQDTYYGHCGFRVCMCLFVIFFFFFFWGGGGRGGLW